MGGTWTEQVAHPLRRAADATERQEALSANPDCYFLLRQPGARLITSYDTSNATQPAGLWRELGVTESASLEHSVSAEPSQQDRTSVLNVVSSFLLLRSLPRAWGAGHRHTLPPLLRPS